MVEFTAIETIIMAYAPLLVTICGIVAAFIKMIATIKNIRKDNEKNNEEKTAEISKLKDEMKQLIDANYTYQAQIKELLTKIDHIRRE